MHDIWKCDFCEETMSTERFTLSSGNVIFCISFLFIYRIRKSNTGPGRGTSDYWENKINRTHILPFHLEMWFCAFRSYSYPESGRATRDYWENKINRTHNLPFHLEMWFVSFLVIPWTGQSNTGLLRKQYQQNTFTLSFGNVIFCISFLFISWTGRSNTGLLRKQCQQNTCTLSCTTFGNVIFVRKQCQQNALPFHLEM